jgi:Invasion protein B, involved in pathogenesis
MFRQFALIVLGMIACSASVASAQTKAPPAKAAQPQQAAQNPAPAASSAPQAPLWLASCSNQAQPDQLQCEFSQSLVLSQGNQRQRVATASFNRVAGKPETNAVFILPHGVSLPNPVKVLVDDKEVGTLTWQTCDANGCYASALVDKVWLQAMRAGKKLTAALKARDGSDLAFSFELNGFAKTEAMLP